MKTIRMPIGLMALAGDSVESYGKRVAGYFYQQRDQMEAIMQVLVDALLEVSGPSPPIMRLREITQRVASVSALDDLLTVRSDIEACLVALRQSRAEQIRIEELRLREAEDISVSVDSFVAVFRLQRAELIASRFGRVVLREMLDVVNTNLKPILGPGDRIERRKDVALVAFIRSRSGLYGLRAQISKIVAAVRLQYINVGSRSALLSIGLDWTVLPQSGPRHPLPAELEAFLSGDTQKVSWSGA
jgi:hypothetical protein